MELLVCTSLDWYACHLFSQWLLNWREFPWFSPTQTRLLSSQAHIHTHFTHMHTSLLQTMTKPTLLSSVGEPEPPNRGRTILFLWGKKKKKDPDGDDDNIADLKIRWNENNMLNMRKSTTLPSAPFHTDTVLFLFVFLLNLPVNQQRPVLWKSKKAFGVEQKSHVCGERR